MNDARTGKQLRLFVGLVAFGGLACAGWAAFSAPPIAIPKIFLVVAVAAILIAANGPIILLRVGTEHRGFDATSAAVLLAVATLPAPWVILCTVVAMAASRLLMQRDKFKASFNAGKDVLAASAAAGAAALTGLHQATNVTQATDATLTVHSIPRLLLGLLAAIIAYALVDDVLYNTVVALSSHTRWRPVTRKNLDVVLTIRAANFVVTVLTLLIISQDPLLIIAMPPTIFALKFAAKNLLRRRTDLEAWRQLAGTTDELNVTDLETVLRAAVISAPDLFSSEEVEVELREDGTVRLVRGSAAGITYDGPPALAPHRDGSVKDVPLTGHDAGAIGVLRLRTRKPLKLDEFETYKLQTFASALTTSIRNAYAYAELKHAAAHDQLTGLANRRELLDRGAQLFEGRIGNGMVALLLIDLNHFKEVNDTLGHNAGDVVLREVAARLEASAAPGELVARLGGDEFAVLLTGLATPAMAAPRAEALLAVLDRGIEVDGMALTIEASGGIALAPGSGSIAELLRRADVAMYQAKRSGRRTASYQHHSDTADVSRLILGSELSRAVAEHEFRVEFQPIVDLASGEVVSAEALARWYHPQHGSLTPFEFLDTVERSGKLPAFADAVLEQSLTALSSWREAGFDLPVAVNVSPRSLLDPGFPALVLRRLAAHAVPAEQLVLELAETLTISQLEVVDRGLRELRDAGVRLALDDFGSGPASLSVLSHIRVHEVKIDQQFVRGVETSTEAAAVIRSTVDLARSLRLTVVAEGVESEPQRRALWELGCVAGQGNLFARPMPGARLLATLQRGSGGRPGTLIGALHDTGSVLRLPRRSSGGRGRPTLPHLPA